MKKHIKGSGKVLFSFQKQISLNNRNRLKEFIIHLFNTENRKKEPGTFQYVFCDDAFLLNINGEFLNHHYNTDIITFDLSEPGSDITDGEIYISVDTVRENAVQYQVPFAEELLRVIFHGILHLCGYKDKTKKDTALMRQKEDEYLNKWYNF